MSIHSLGWPPLIIYWLFSQQLLYTYMSLYMDMYLHMSICK